jgi:hypothetical protein
MSIDIVVVAWWTLSGLIAGFGIGFCVGKKRGEKIGAQEERWRLRLASWEGREFAKRVIRLGIIK